MAKKKKRAGKAPSVKKNAATTKNGKPQKKKKARTSMPASAKKKKKRAATSSTKSLTILGAVATCDADHLGGFEVAFNTLSQGNLLGCNNNGTDDQITNVSVGSPLQCDGADLTIDLASLAGDGLTDANGDLAIALGPGVTTNAGELTIQVGLGLELDGDSLKVKVMDLAGAGLQEEAGTGALTIKASDGITLDGNGVTIDKGTGLTFNGTQLTIDPATDPGNLTGAEPLADVITKINDLLDALRNAGFLS